MTAVNGDGLSREHLIRQVAKRLSPELRAEYYDMLRHCRSLPVNDELLVILNAIQLLPTLTIDLPAQMASEREKIESLLKSNAKAQEHLLQTFVDHQAKFDQRLASFPQEIAKLINPEMIAALVTESVRQQFDKTAIPETTKLVRSGADDVNAAVVELRSGARTIGKVMNETLLEGNGFLKRVESLCLDGTEKVACATERMVTILNASIGGLILLACSVGVAVGLMLGIFLHDWWNSPAPPVQPVTCLRYHTALQRRRVYNRPRNDNTMKCVICKTGEIKQASVQTEIKVGRDRLLVMVQADACVECGEPYYSADTLRHLEHVRHGFVRKEFVPRLVGKVYEIR